MDPDYESGRVVWVGQERKSRTLRGFFSAMTREQRRKLEAVVMDMWAPYIAPSRIREVVERYLDYGNLR